MQLAHPFRLGAISAALLVLTSVTGWSQPPQPQTSGRAYLGVFIGPSQQGTAGALVGDVTPDSPAAKAGLKKGDQIVKLGDKQVQSVEAFLQAVESKKPGDKLTLGILRDNKEQNLTVTLAERPAQEAPRFPRQPGLRRPAFLGVQMLPLTPELRQRLKMEANAAGVVVTDVVPNSPAAKAGLKRDDVITAIDDHEVKNPMELRRAVQTAGPGKEVKLQVLRGTEKVTIKASLGEGSFGLGPMPGEGFPNANLPPMIDQSHRIQELEQQVEDMQKRIDALEKKTSHGPEK